jgi:hypothetical protein
VDFVLGRALDAQADDGAGGRLWNVLLLLKELHGRRDETCAVSTGGGTRRVQSVREEGRDVSSQYGHNTELSFGNTGKTLIGCAGGRG